MVVHALRVLPIALAARLPLALEDIVRAVGEGGELRRSGGKSCQVEERRDWRAANTGEKPGDPGSRRTHGTPFRLGSIRVADEKNPWMTGRIPSIRRPFTHNWQAIRLF